MLLPVGTALSPLVQSLQKGKSKRARLMISGRTILFTHFIVDRGQAENRKGGIGRVNKHYRFKLETVQAGCCLLAESDRFEQLR
ncbi:hypothetical protein D0Y65_052119 [Glycine soja]|uniref:Uncharacterized protein n=1 Tax=Glycine soja TaxID=3848 RepID=A0A445FJD4_GLYSO|nr:hypothetical protein D0Y65_052119 [Glycine soja]RZB48976.1 hypothetical protein D0Y65_052119 [Glycine soja]